MVDAAAYLQEYAQVLESINSDPQFAGGRNSKPVINNATEFALDAVGHGLVLEIVRATEAKIATSTSGDRKLLLFYVLDSICKNVKVRPLRTRACAAPAARR